MQLSTELQEATSFPRKSLGQHYSLHPFFKSKGQQLPAAPISNPEQQFSSSLSSSPPSSSPPPPGAGHPCCLHRVPQGPFPRTSPTQSEFHDCNNGNRTGSATAMIREEGGEDLTF